MQSAQGPNMKTVRIYLFLQLFQGVESVSHIRHLSRLGVDFEFGKISDAAAINPRYFIN